MRLFALRTPPPAIVGGGIFLRRPELDDYPAWQALREESRAFLKPWEPRWPDDDLTRAGFRRRLDRYRRDAQSATAITWFAFRETDGELLGGITLSCIRMGASRSGQIGYWMGARHAGKGYMAQAVRLVLLEAFGALGLERVEAACLPHNERSRRLLSSAGFVEEGHLRGYLEIDGARRDHVLYAILKRDFVAAGGLSGRQRNMAPIAP